MEDSGTCHETVWKLGDFMKWTEDLIKSELFKSMEILGISRMPSRDELDSIGKMGLSIRIERTKKYSGWAKELGLEMKGYKKESSYKATAEYKRIRDRKYRRTTNGLVKSIYQDEVKNSKKRNMEMGYTRDEFKEWILSQPKFFELHQKWVESNYDRNLVPSVDRIDHKKPYEFGNVQLLTFGENVEKAKNERPSKRVFQYDLEGNFIKEYPSITQAKNETGVSKFSISHCALGIYKTGGGFIWKYEDNCKGKFRRKM